MQYRKKRLLGIVWPVLLMTLPLQAGTAERALLCGVARSNITPLQPVTLAGYANRSDLSEGIHDSLYVRVVAFSDGQEQLVLVSTDIIGFYSGTAAGFRQEILKAYQLKPSALFLSAIHTPRLFLKKMKPESAVIVNLKGT